MREQKHNGTHFLIAAMCLIGFVSLVVGAFLFDNSDVKAAKVSIRK